MSKSSEGRPELQFINFKWDDVEKPFLFLVILFWVNCEFRPTSVIKCSGKPVNLVLSGRY